MSPRPVLSSIVTPECIAGWNAQGCAVSEAAECGLNTEAQLVFQERGSKKRGGHGSMAYMYASAGGAGGLGRTLGV